MRFVIGKKGNLLWVESFLLPNAISPGAFAAVEPAEIFISEEKGYRLVGEEKQLYFPQYDPGSAYPIWRILAETPARVLAEFFVDYQSGELIEERHVQFGLDGGADDGADAPWSNGALLSRQPTTDTASPGYYFTTPQHIEIDQVVKGLQIISGQSFTISEAGGRFNLSVEDDALVRLDNLLCDENERMEGTRVCPSELLQGDSRGIVRVFRTRERFSEERTLATFVPQIQRQGDWTILRINPDPPAVPPGPDQEEMLEERRREQNLRAAELMAFHHVTEFLELHERVLSLMSEGESAHADIAVPLDIDVSAEPVQSFLYTPTTSSAKIHLSPRADYTDRGPYQWLTPTIVNHEYAHHIIFELSGVYASRTFHCYSGGPFPPNVNCMGPFGPRDSSTLRSAIGGGLIEGLADALAAYRASNPRIAYYAPTGQHTFKDAYMRHDISKPELRINERTRDVVAKLFWDLRETIDNAVRQVESLNSEQKELAPYLFLYSWIRAHASPDGVSQIGIPSPEFAEELYILGQELFDWEMDRQVILEALKDATDPAQIKFIRGDVNYSRKVDMSDVISTLAFLFLGEDGIVTCLDAYDVDDSGLVDISDPISLLAHLFLGGVEIPEPTGKCGTDPTEDPLRCIAGGVCVPGF